VHEAVVDKDDDEVATLEANARGMPCNIVNERRDLRVSDDRVALARNAERHRMRLITGLCEYWFDNVHAPPAP